MLFNDLYVGVPPGQSYPDYTEIFRFIVPLNAKDFHLESSMKITLESDLNKDIDDASRIYN
jgi:hypothetical protein